MIIIDSEQALEYMTYIWQVVDETVTVTLIIVGGVTALWMALNLIENAIHGKISFSNPASNQPDLDSWRDYYNKARGDYGESHREAVKYADDRSGLTAWRGKNK